MTSLSRNYNQRTPVAVPSMMTGAASAGASSPTSRSTTTRTNSSSATRTCSAALSAHEHCQGRSAVAPLEDAERAQEDAGCEDDLNEGAGRPPPLQDVPDVTRADARAQC